MDVIYPVKGHSEQLRYSLRSLVHMPHSRVVTCGTEQPGLRVEHVPCDFPHASQPLNIAHQLLKVLPTCSERVAIMSDDIYLLAPYTPEGVTYRDTIAEALRKLHDRPSNDPWVATLRRTAAATAMDAPLCSTHRPQVVDRDGMVVACLRSLELGGVEPVTLFAHLHPCWPAAKATNVKQARPWTGPPKDAAVFSSSPRVEASPAFKAWLHGMFPDKCGYER